MLKTVTKYRTIFDLIDEMIFLIDVNGNIIEYNQFVTRILGCDAGSLINKPLKELIVKEHWSTLYELLNSKGTRKVHTIQIITSGGVSFDASVQVYNVKTNNENYSILFVKNVKSSKSDNTELLILLSSLERSMIPFEITDENRKIIYVNKALEKEIQYPHNELIGQTFTKYLTDVNLDLFLEKDKVLKEFVELKRKDGTTMISDMLLSPLYVDGKTRGYFIFFAGLSKN
jgi:PAS domain S-box-containing protein